MAGYILAIAAWFGLVTGLVEGVESVILQQLGWSRPLMAVSIEIVWIAALFDLLMFAALGAALAPLARVLPKAHVLRLAVFLFASLAFFDWLAVALSGRIFLYALLILAMGLAAGLTRWFRKYEAAALHFCRRSLPWVAAVTILALLGIQGGLWVGERIAIAKLPPAPSGSLNVVVIVVDALRADHLSGYGYLRPTSPNLDRIARQGVVFDKAFSTSAWTSPSHASLLTGRYPYEHRVEWHTPRALLDDRYPTLAEALQARGYRTGAFSANLFWFTRPMGFGRGFIRFEDYFHSVGDMATRTLYGRAIERLVFRPLGFEDIPARKRASDINRSVLRWIDRDRDKPFFVFLNYMDTHDPYLPPEPYRNMFSKVKNPGGILNWRTGRSHPQMTTEQLQGEIDAYDGGIAYVDAQIGQLLSKLRERTPVENMLVVITSDHGESFGEHDLFLHGNSLYREQIHVPLILWGTGHLPRAVRIARPITNAALPATIMDLIGAGDQASFPLQSLRPLWVAPQAHSDWPYPLAEIAQQPWAVETYPVYYGALKSLINPEWHYIVHERRGAELYDWQEDPRELRNLTERPDMERIVHQFWGWLQQVSPQGRSARGKSQTQPHLARDQEAK